MAIVQSENVALNFVGGEWSRGNSTETFDVFNPATSELLAKVQMGGRDDVNAAVKSASAAYPEWRRTPPQNRIQFLFKFRALLEEHGDEIARITTQENGKTFA